MGRLRQNFEGEVDLRGMGPSWALRRDSAPLHLVVLGNSIGLFNGKLALRGRPYLRGVETRRN